MTRRTERLVQLREVVSRIDLGTPSKIPRVILSVSPCRSGTTVFLRVFGHAGIQSHHQQLKNILRWRLHGGEAKWQLPQEPDNIVFVKETIGPHTESEARFNPLEVLLKAGFPPHKLQVVIIGRAPLSTWASWYQWWKGRATVAKFILAHQTTELVRQQAFQQGLPLTTFVYEALRDNDVEIVVKNLFRRLDIPYVPTAVKGWANLPSFGEPNSNIVWPNMPGAYHRWDRDRAMSKPHLHTRVEQADRLTYYSRDEDIPTLKPSDIGQIRSACLSELYDAWRQRCEIDLNVKVEEDHSWELVPDTANL
jgi:hypothetical protein